MLNSAGADPDYTISENNNGKYEIEIKRYPGGTTPPKLTVEYLTANSAAANRASFVVTFDGSDTWNTIGAVKFSDLSVKTTSNGLLNASVDATILGNTSDDLITLAISAEHPDQPQADFDEEALGELFEGLGFNLKTLIAGIEAFLEALENGLANDLLAKIPIGGKDIAKKIAFIKKLRENFVAPLRDELCNNVGGLDAVKDVVSRNLTSHIQQFLGSTSSVQVTKLTTEAVEIVLRLDYEEKFVVDFDSGLIGLPIQAAGQGGVEAKLVFDAEFGFGIDQQNGFYLLSSRIDRETLLPLPGPELIFSADVGLLVDPADPIPTSMVVNLFGLKLSATDILTASHTTGTRIFVDVEADFVDPNPSDDGIVTLDELENASFAELFQPGIQADDHGGPYYASAGADINLLLEAGISDTLPSVQAEIDLGWHFNITYDQQNGIVADSSGFDFRFKDIGINVGSFLNRHIRPVLDQITRYIKPLQGVIDLLKQAVPGVTQLSEARGNGPVTFLDLALQKNPSQAAAAKKFINALDTILRLSKDMEGLEPDELMFILQDEMVIMNLTDSGSQRDLGNADSPEAVSLEDAKADSGGALKKAQGFVKQLLQSLKDLGVGLQILDTRNIIAMLLHRPFDIISYDIPRFDLGFSWEKSFAVWSPPPIDVRIGLDFSVFADLSVGYDSHGIDTGRFFDGFYFGDRADVFRGADIDELGLSLGVRLAAILNLGVASAGIEGEIRGDATANWRDSDNDGKMHLDEMVRIVKQDGIFCLFDLGVDVHAIVRLVWEVFGEEGSKDFIDQVILELRHKCPLYELGHVLPGSSPSVQIIAGLTAETTPGTLIIHAGPYANLRRRGNTSDTHEDAKITQLAPGTMKVELLGLEQVFTDVQQIFMSGGFGDDSLLLIDVDVPVTVLGGAGNDILVGTAKRDYLDGGAGNDELRGRGEADKIYGGDGDDLIFGGGRDSLARIPEDKDSLFGNDLADVVLSGGTGRDVIFAGAGDDLFVDGGAGRDIIFGEEGDDTLKGGTGVDLLIGGAGGDILLGEEGNDALLGGLLSDLAGRGMDVDGVFTALRGKFLVGLDPRTVLIVTNTSETGSDGSDVLKGGTGNDLAVGDHGSDFIYGGWGNDLLVGYLLGAVNDNSGDYIEGNPGDDVICGTDGIDRLFGGTNVDGSPISGLLDVLAEAGTPESGGGYSVVDCTSTAPVTISDDPTSMIVGIVYEDLSLDGVRDLGEPILIGWTIELLDVQGQVVATAITDSAGAYQFGSVESGNYTVREIAPLGWAPVLPAGGVTAVAVSGRTAQTITVNSGNRRDVGRIIVRDFHDLNADGNPQPADKLLDNWLVEVVGPDGSVFRRTGEFDLNHNGQIETEEHVAVFDNLPVGDYVVRETPRSGWVQSSPSLDTFLPDVRLAIPNDGVSELRSIVSVDSGSDTLQNVEVHFNVEHENLAELAAYLIGPGGEKVTLRLAPAGTAHADGYSRVFQAVEAVGSTFSGQIKGNWTLVIRDTDDEHAGTLKEWALVVTTSSSALPAIKPAKQASIYYPGTANEYHVHVSSSGDATLIFGNFQPVTINGFKFSDNNGNGIQDGGERGLGGVMLFVDSNDNGIRDQSEPKGMTLFDDPETLFNEEGYFTIGSVRPGSNLKVREELLNGFRQTVPADDGIGPVTSIVVAVLNSGEKIGTSAPISGDRQTDAGGADSESAFPWFDVCQPTDGLDSWHEMARQ